MKIRVPLIINDIPPVFNDPYWRAGNNRKLSKLFANLRCELSYRTYIRTRLSEAQNWKCCWCGVVCTDVRDMKNSSTIEHVTPRSQGGSDSFENLAMACARCNQKRDTHSVEEFINIKSINDIKPEQKRQQRMEAKYVRHVKRGKMFAENGWKTPNGYQYSLDKWINSIQGLNDQIKQKLYETFATDNESRENA